MSNAIEPCSFYCYGALVISIMVWDRLDEVVGVVVLGAIGLYAIHLHADVDIMKLSIGGIVAIMVGRSMVDTKSSA